MCQFVSAHAQAWAQESSVPDDYPNCFEMTTVKNAASWKLNAAEKKELADRVSHGEDESTVKRELQNKKAQASADRKPAAAAVAAKCALQSTKAAASKAKAKAKNKAAAANAASAASAPSGALEEEQLNDAANKAYYCQVLEDCQLVLSEFGEDFRKEGPLAITGAGDATSGVQEPFDRSKAQTALSVHGCYRASISVWGFSNARRSNVAPPRRRLGGILLWS